MAISKIPRDSVRWLFAEMLVVVLGILFAFQVEEFRSRLSDRDEEQASLQAIIRDLDAGEREFGLWESALDKNIGYFELLIGHISGSASVSQNQLEDRINLGFSGRYWAPTSPAYTGMRDSGKLRLISNPELQSLIVRYFDIREIYIMERRIELQSLQSEFIEILNHDVLIVPPKNLAQGDEFRSSLAVSLSDFPTHPKFMESLSKIYKATKIVKEGNIASSREALRELRSRIQSHLESIN